jgi:isoleucyl-tRNA synthetase
VENLDRWILLGLDSLTSETTRLLEGYRVSEAAKGIEGFVDDLTNWYIRRSRDRFWAPAGEATDDKESAYQALYTVLTTTARLIAPMTPFVAEVLHGNLIRSQEPDARPSVHLEDWPVPPGDRADRVLEEGMAAVQRIVRLGHAARNAHGLKTRQPLPAVTIVTTNTGLGELVEPKLELLRDELNVREVKWADERSAYVHHEVRPVFPVCGPRFGKQMPALKRALEAGDGDALAAQLEEKGSIAIELEGQKVELSTDEVEVRLVEREGMATQGDRELLVALDTTLDDDLIAEGWAREVIHRLQSARKEADLDYADRIRVRYRADPELETAIDTHRRWIAGETLATELAAADGDAVELETNPVEGMNFAFSLEKVN